MATAAKNPVKSFAKDFEKEFRKFHKAIRKDGKVFVQELKKMARDKKLKLEHQRFAETLETSLRTVEDTTSKLLARIHAGANKFETMVTAGLGKAKTPRIAKPKKTKSKSSGTSKAES